MQNEFEKQVKAKMEELDFVPSAPVWPKIEAQIRQEKDRRRLLLWLPLLTLLVGGGITWFIINASDKSSLSNQPAVEKTNEEKPLIDHLPLIPEKPTVAQEATEGPVIIETGNENRDLSNEVILEQPAIEKTNQAGTKIKKEPAMAQEKLYTAERKIESFKNTYDKKINSNSLVPDAEPLRTAPKNDMPVTEPVIEKSNQKVQPSKEKLAVPVADSQVKKQALVLQDFPIVNGQETVNQDVADQLSAQKDSSAVAITSPAKTFGRSKWKLGFEFLGGISGAGEGLPLYTRRQEVVSDVANNAPPPPSYLQNRSMEPSPIENGISFGAGFIVQKQINQRFALSTGLRYQYLSTSRKVGFKMISFSSGNTGTGVVPGTYTAAQYHDYVNRFHFVTLPVTVDYRPMKKIPLQVQGGLSLHHLVGTNALHYNQLSRVYQKDEEQFRKNQVFAEGGLNYSFPLKKLSVTAGPQVQYSLMSLGEAYYGQHLFTVGFKTKILFNN